MQWNHEELNSQLLSTSWVLLPVTDTKAQSQSSRRSSYRLTNYVGKVNEFNSLVDPSERYHRWHSPWLLANKTERYRKDLFACLMLSFAVLAMLKHTLRLQGCVMVKKRRSIAEAFKRTKWFPWTFSLKGRSETCRRHSENNDKTTKKCIVLTNRKKSHHIHDYMVGWERKDVENVLEMKMNTVSESERVSERKTRK